MPEIVSCPNCRRRSRLPDALIGKKVKCPECKEVFTAAVAGPPPAKTEAVKSKRDEADPGYEVVDEDEDEPKPRKKRRSDEDDERVSDRPRSRRRDDEDDEDDEGLTRRRRRVSRDDDDDDEDNEDEDYGRLRKRPRVRANWSRVLTGLNLILWSTIISVGLYVVLALGGMICLTMAARGGPAGAAGGLIALALGTIAGIFVCYVTKIVGHVLCLPSGEARGCRALALTTVILVFTELGLIILGWALGVAQAGMAGLAGAANPMPDLADAAVAGVSLVVGWSRVLAAVAGFFVFLFYLRAVALVTGNDWLAENIVKFMYAVGGCIVGVIIMMIIMRALVGGATARMAANRGDPGGAGVGICLCGCGFCITELAVGISMLVWYIRILGNTRNALACRMGRM
jgi:hypothetical protein